MTLTNSPEQSYHLPVNRCIDWCFIDEDFVVSEGDAATVAILKFENGQPIPNGTVITILGSEFVAESSFSSAGTAEQIMSSLAAAVQNRFFLEVETDVFTTAIYSRLTITWFNIGEQANFINQSSNNAVLIGGINGTEPEYANRKMHVQLLEKTSEGLVLRGEKRATQTVQNGELQEVCFDFQTDIKRIMRTALQSGLSPAAQRVFCVRYASLEMEDCQESAGNYAFSEDIMVINSAIQAGEVSDWGYLQSPQQVPFLNRHQTQCLPSNLSAWLYFSGHLNHFFSAWGLTFTYELFVQRKDKNGNVTGSSLSPVEGSSYGIDGVFAIPIGSNSSIPPLAGYTHTFQIKARYLTPSGTTGNVFYSDPFTIKYTLCDKQEVHWLESKGAFSTLPFDYLDAIDIQTKGTKVEVEMGCENNNRSGYRYINWKALRTWKMKIELSDDEVLLTDFLASPERYVKDELGNLRRIVVKPNSAKIYRKKEAVEVILEYTYNEDYQVLVNGW